MFDRALRNILELMRKEVICGWRDLHKWAGHVANMRKKRNAWGRDSRMKETTWKNLGVEGKKLLKCALKKYDTRMRAAKMWLRIGVCGELFWTRKLNFEFHKMAGNFSIR